jgi:hypothetical protein
LPKISARAAAMVSRPGGQVEIVLRQPSSWQVISGIPYDSNFGSARLVRRRSRCRCDTVRILTCSGSCSGKIQQGRRRLARRPAAMMATAPEDGRTGSSTRRARSCAASISDARHAAQYRDSGLSEREQGAATICGDRRQQVERS